MRREPDYYNCDPPEGRCEWCGADDGNCDCCPICGDSEKQVCPCCKICTYPEYCEGHEEVNE